MFVADADVVSSVETAVKVTTVAAAALAAMLSVHVIVSASDPATAVVNVAVRTVWVAETA